MKVLRPLLNQRGFSLLFIVLLFTAAGLLAFAGLSLKFSRAGSNIATTHRMRVIHAAAQNYYRGHGTLPPGTAVPVSALGLDSRYKYDSFGQEFYFNWANDPGPGCTASAIDINGYTVDGPVASGVILSYGPDQAQNTTVTVTTTTNIFTNDDDISLGINLFEQAQEKARQKLQILADKVWVTKYCTKKYLYPGTLTIDVLISTYSLTNDSRFDPWCDQFLQDNDSNFYTLAGTPGGAPIKVAQRTSPCPNAQNDSAGGPGTPPGGTTEAVAYWNFNNPFNVGLNDSYASDGVNAGVDSLASNGCGGNALYFNDNDTNLNNDYANDSNSANYSFGRNDSFSIVASIKALTNDSVIVSKMPAGGSGPGYELAIDTTGHLNFIIIDNDSSENTIKVFSSTMITDGSCHHIAATYSGNDSSTGLYVYVDGNDSSTNRLLSSLLNDSIQNTIAFQVSGRNGNDSLSLYNGYVDNLAVYDQALSPGEVSSLYNNRYSGECQPSYCP